MDAKIKMKTIEDGVITKDLSQLLTTPNKKVVTTEEFLYAIKERLTAEI